ncbi:MAG: UDP-2,3-diacylglucosamine hydrolase [Saprospiraceae bacterium]|jgi:UDP-2,3-diacylglucosamine hydrolase
MEEKNHIYFASDFHLGVPDHESSRKRELLLVKWLDKVAKDAAEIYLIGDIFDFWFEYRSVVPKGHVRLLGKLAEVVDSGIKVTLFTGNHDMWMFDYLEKEIGVSIQREPIVKEFSSKTFYLGHGDGLGPGDYKYKFLKKVFANKLCQWLFARVHPNFAFGIAKMWSGKSRLKNNKKEEGFTTKENEWLYEYSKSLLFTKHYDYFIFGHRHLPLDLSIDGYQSRYINLGEWVTGNPHYAVFDGKELSLRKLS